MAQSGQTIRLEEAAMQFGVSTDELLRLNSAGHLTAWQEGEQWLFSLESLNAAAEEGLLAATQTADSSGDGSTESEAIEPASGVFDDLFQESNAIEEDSFNPDASPTELASKSESLAADAPISEATDDELSDELPPMIFDEEEDDEAEDTEEIIRSAQARYAEEEEQEQSIFFDAASDGLRKAGLRKPRVDEEPTEEVLDLSNETPSHLRFTPSDWELLRSLPVAEEESLVDEDSFVPVYSDDDIALPSESDADHAWIHQQRNDSVIMRDNDSNGELPKLAEAGDGYDKPPRLDDYEPEMPVSAENSNDIGDALASDIDFPDIELNVPGATVVMQGNRNVLEQLSAFTKQDSAEIDPLATESEDNELSALNDPPSSANSSSSFRNLLDELHAGAAENAPAVSSVAPSLEPPSEEGEVELADQTTDAISDEQPSDDHLTSMSLSQFADLVETDAGDGDGEETIGDLLGSEPADPDDEISVLEVEVEESFPSESVSTQQDQDVLHEDASSDQLDPSENLMVGDFSGIFSGSIDIAGLTTSSDSDRVEEISALEEAEGFEPNVSEASYQGPSPLHGEISALEEAEGFEPNISEASYQGVSPLLGYADLPEQSVPVQSKDDSSIAEIAAEESGVAAKEMVSPQVESPRQYAPHAAEVQTTATHLEATLTEESSPITPEATAPVKPDVNSVRQQRLAEINLGEQLSMLGVALLLAFLTFLLFEILLFSFGGEANQGRTILLEPFLEWLTSARAPGENN